MLITVISPSANTNRSASFCIFFRSTENKDVESEYSAFSDLETILRRISQTSGGLTVDSTDSEQGIKEIEKHVDIYYELIYEWNGKIEEKQIQVQVKNKKMDLSYSKNFPKERIDSLIQFLSREKVRIEQALQLRHDFPPALLAKVPLLLYLRNFENAENCYQRMLTVCPEWKKSYFMYLLGLEVYSCSQNLQALTRLYKINADRNKKNNRDRSDSMKADSNLYKKVGKKQLFQTETSSDKIVFPLRKNSKDKRSNILFITIKEKI